MDRRRVIFFTIGALAVIIGIILIASLSGKNEELETILLPDSLVSSDCKKSFSPLPLLIFGMDGFKPDYLERGLTPMLSELAKKGVFTPMTPSFPSVTFPNFYTIVTGLNPESHGIIANSFYDPKYNETFSYKGPSSEEAKWWGGEPIWNTIKKKNLLSATYFWVGSEAPTNEQRPDYWFKYNKSVKNEDKVKQIIDWLLLPEVQRPSLITIYTNEPDSTGHGYGPDSEEVNEKLKEVDGMMKMLIEQLIEHELLPCINMIIVSDHGMAYSGEEGILNITNFVPESIQNEIEIVEGPTPRIRIKPGSTNSSAIKNVIESSLSCKNDEYHLFRREEIPKRFHYNNNDRIEDYVLLTKEGISVKFNGTYNLEGLHGYDNQYPSMQALFMAYGPDFKNQFQSKPFQNVELYELMCHLLGVEPAPNNGTGKLIYSLLKSPPDATPNNYVQNLIVPQIGNPEEIETKLQASGCSKKEEFKKILELLATSSNQIPELKKKISPWGIPFTASEEDLQLLYHPDHITAHSPEQKMALWTSFVAGKKVGHETGAWWIDARLSDAPNLFCSSSNLVSEKNYTFLPLFPPEYSSSSDASAVAYLASNAVPLHLEMAAHWANLFSHHIPRWVDQNSNPIYVTLGPVFKLTSSPNVNLKDPLNEDIYAPEGYFVILARCSESLINGEICSAEHLEQLSFVFPQRLSTDCYETPEAFLEMFQTKIIDIEMLTNLKFFPHLETQDRLNVVSSEFSKLW